MASRRSRSRSRSRSTATRSSTRSSSRASSASATPKRPSIDRDGKASVSCPNCGQRYKILEAALEDKVKCTQCHRLFYPLAAANARRPKQDPTKAVVTVAAVVIGLVVVGAVISNLSGPQQNQNSNQEQSAGKKEIAVDGSTAEVQSAMTWAKALSTENRLDLVGYSDMEAMQKKLDIDKKTRWAETFGPSRKELEDKIVDAMFKGEAAFVFRAFDPSFGRIADPKMVAAKKGRINMSLTPKDPAVNSDSANVTIEYEWDPGDKRFKVTDWATDYVHPAQTRKFKEEAGLAKPKHKTHEVLGKAKTVKTVHLGRSVKVREADLKPLAHLESTSEADRKAIDDLIGKLVDLHGKGANYNRAELALQKFGKAAVPRVLNKMYEYQGLKSQDDVDIVNRLCRYLRTVTGQRFGFNPSAAGDTDVGATEKERLSAMRQWFGYWADYHDRDTWNELIDDDEDSLLTEEEKAARRKAEANKK